MYPVFTEKSGVKVFQFCYVVAFPKVYDFICDMLYKFVASHRKDHQCAAVCKLMQRF